ncbi:hypothetical protein MKX01_028910 [Papaver californicum]|nr:hypothetical protein MKX01_028910 [Papaver californicum]
MEQVEGRYGYYTILGISKHASQSEIRKSYRKLALVKAYAVLSDERKKSMYDVGLYDPLQEEDEEMLSMMENTQNQQNSFEDLQKMFNELTRGDRLQFHNEDDEKDIDQTARKRVRGTASPSQFSSMPAPIHSNVI